MEKEEMNRKGQNMFGEGKLFVWKTNKELDGGIFFEDFENYLT